MVVDSPNWAFDISARDMAKFIKGHEFKIINYYEEPGNPEHYKDADLIYLFGHYMIDWLPKDIDMKKVCAGVRALFGYVDGSDHKQDPWDSDNAQHILKIPRIHAVSQESYDIMKEFHPNVDYVCHGVDTEFFTSKQDYSREGKFKLGWAGNPTNLVKNIDLVKKAIANGRTDTELLMAEFGEKQLNREELRDFYQSLDAFVLPSLSEGCSAALLEAMSCGLPVIATDTGTWIEFKKLGGGFTMECSTKGFNEALDQMIKLKPEELKRMGEINRKEMETNWCWEKKAKDFEDFFNKAMKYKPTAAKTIKCFEEKWKMMPGGYGFKNHKQVKFFVDWTVKKYGFKTVDQLNKFYAGKKNVLEVGFGSGFNLHYINSKSDAKLTAVDTSPTACEELEKLLPETVVVNDSLMNIKTEEPFDLIVADGVLHHLFDTKAAIKHLYSLLAKGGHMYVYLYKKTGRIREFTNDYLRFKFKDMDPKECADSCKELTQFAKNLAKIKTKIKIGNVPLLGMKPGNYTPHEIFYYGVMKAFWNDSFSFEENNLNNYDWFYPEFAHRFSEDEVKEWMKDWGYKYKLNDASHNGIHLLITK